MIVDSGCSQSLVTSDFVQAGSVQHATHKLVTADGHSVDVDGAITLDVEIRGRNIRVECLILKRLVDGIPMILGMDVINMMGGVTVRGSEEVSFGLSVSAAPEEITIVDPDFEAVFDNGCWTVKWVWKDCEPVLTNDVSCYGVSAEHEAEFLEELHMWISEGWLIPAPEYEGPVLPLMAVVQQNKNKVRPVIDYRHVNEHVVNHTGSAGVCGDTLRRWRQVGENCALLDLRRAYLQIHVAESLWKHQVVRLDGKCYYLTRLGFGLRSAPKIMQSIVGKVLSLNSTIDAATDHYIDDILVNEAHVTTEQVAVHLAQYGLESKPADQLDRARVLGLQVYDNGDTLRWRRGNVMPQLKSPITKRELFLACGILIGHFPV